MSSSSPPQTLTGIHHLKIPVSSIPTTQSFYTSILNFTHIPEYDHIKKETGELYAAILKGPGGVWIELRHNEGQAGVQKFWDPITWSVPLKEDLEKWRGWFESRGVRCSRVMKGAKGWVLCALDPDEKMVRIYCEESHEWTRDVDEDEFWIR